MALLPSSLSALFASSHRPAKQVDEWGSGRQSRLHHVDTCPSHRSGVTSRIIIVNSLVSSILPTMTGTPRSGNPRCAFYGVKRKRKLRVFGSRIQLIMSIRCQVKPMSTACAACGPLDSRLETPLAQTEGKARRDEARCGTAASKWALSPLFYSSVGGGFLFGTSWNLAGYCTREGVVKHGGGVGLMGREFVCEWWTVVAWLGEDR